MKNIELLNEEKRTCECCGKEHNVKIYMFHIYKMHNGVGLNCRIKKAYCEKKDLYYIPDTLVTENHVTLMRDYAKILDEDRLAAKNSNEIKKEPMAAVEPTEVQETQTVAEEKTPILESADVTEKAPAKEPETTVSKLNMDEVDFGEQLSLFSMLDEDEKERLFESAVEQVESRIEKESLKGLDDIVFV